MKHKLNQDQSSIQFGNCTFAKSTRKVQRKKMKKYAATEKLRVWKQKEENLGNLQI
jgi:hypothetical protein